MVSHFVYKLTHLINIKVKNKQAAKLNDLDYWNCQNKRNLITASSLQDQNTPVTHTLQR